MEIGPRIRRHRRRLGWTLQDVADRCGFTRSLLSKIENGRTVPPVATLARIAEALGLSVATLLDDQADDATVFTPADRTDAGRMTTTDMGYRFLALAGGRAGKLMQPLLFEAERGRVEPRALQHGGEEFVYVLEGRMRYRVGSAEYTLGPGDSLYFHAEQAHTPQPITEKVRYLAIFVEHANESAEAPASSAADREADNGRARTRPVKPSRTPRKTSQP
jgi:transcriptional regulator with XRE-family HTH domain